MRARQKLGSITVAKDGESQAETTTPHPHPAVILAARTLTAFLIIAALKLGQTFFLPIALSILVSFFLTPAARKLERNRVPRYPSAVLLVACLLFLAVGFGWFVSSEAASVLRESPQFRANLSKRYTKVVERFNYSFAQVQKTLEPKRSEKITITPSTIAGAPSVISIPPPESASVPPSISPMAILSSLGLALAEIVLGILIIAVLSVFLLAHREDAYDRVLGLAGESRVVLTTRVLGDVVNGVRRYLLLNFAVNVIFSLGLAVVLLFLGVPDPILWASVAVFLRFVPHIGVYLALVPPLVCTLALTTGWYDPFVLLVAGVGLDVIVSNFIEPRVYGRGIGVSSIAIVISALFWVWCWGLIGLLLATPFTVCLAVLGRYVPGLESFSILFGQDTGLKPAYKFYHRLVASDLVDAKQYIDQYFAQHPNCNVDDELIVPAALFAEADFQSMLLARNTYEGILAMLEEVSRIADKPTLADVGHQSENVRAFIIPMKADSEGLLAKIVERRLEKLEFLITRIPERSFAGEAVQLVAQGSPSLIVLLSLSTRSIPNLNFLLKRMASTGVKCPVLVLSASPETRSLRSLYALPAVSIVGTLQELDAKVHALNLSKERPKIAA